MPHKRFMVLLVIILGLLIVFCLGILTVFKSKNTKSETIKDNVEVNYKPGSESPKFFSEKELAAANLALAKGIKVEDPQNDWWRFPSGLVEYDGRPNNTNPYPLGWTDLRSLSMGADEKYLYVKYQFWDKFPEKSLTYNGDLIVAVGAKINSLTFVNNEGKKDQANLDNSIFYANRDESGQQVELNNIKLDHNARISPTGRDKNNETNHKIETRSGLVGGGPGWDYLLAAYPLSLFNLSIGDEITFDSSTETGSNKYHHEAADLLLLEEGSKFGITIKYKLGSDKYELMPNADKFMHE